MKLQSPQYYRIPTKKEIFAFASAEAEIRSLFYSGEIEKSESDDPNNENSFENRLYAFIKDREIKERNPDNEYFYKYIDHVIDIYHTIKEYMNRGKLSRKEIIELLSYVIYFNHCMIDKLDFPVPEE